LILPFFSKSTFILFNLSIVSIIHILSITDFLDNLIPQIIKKNNNCVVKCGYAFVF